MHRARVVSVLLIPIVLVLAHAACAPNPWVLWELDGSFSGSMRAYLGSQKGEWKVLDGSSSEEGCRIKLRETMTRVLNRKDSEKNAENDSVYKVDGSTITIFYFPKTAMETDTAIGERLLRYVCLPDTVDPREKTGPR